MKTFFLLILLLLVTMQFLELANGRPHYQDEAAEYRHDHFKYKTEEEEFKALAEEFTEYVEHLKSGNVVGGSAKCIAAIKDTGLELKKCLNPFEMKMSSFQHFKGEDLAWESEVDLERFIFDLF